MNKLLSQEEVTALLQGLMEGRSASETEDALPHKASPPVSPPGLPERLATSGFQKITTWWTAITELRWPQL